MSLGLISVTGELQIWVAALLTLMVFSFLYRDNPFYRFAEHLLVGVSAAYAMVIGFWSTLWPNALLKLAPSLERVTNPEAVPGAPDYWVVVPVGLGCLLLCRLVPDWAWLSRWPTAFAIGTTAGYTLIRTLRSDFMNQIAATVGPGLVVLTPQGVALGPTLDNLLVLVGTVCGLAYFTYTRSQEGALGRMARTGILIMMVTFGASFGYSVMGRMTVLIERLRMLLGEWLNVL
jgi:hypothetical protein